MTGGNFPRVSIGVPVYNGDRFLAATMDALLAQTYQDLEIIIGDNASTDRTESIGRAYAAQDSRVRFIRHDQNLGLARNCMRLLELARGELFRWAAADDLCAPEAVQACVEALDHEPGAILAYPKTVLIDEAGEFLREYEDNLNLSSPQPSERFRGLIMRLGLCNAIFGLMRTTVLRRTRGMGSYVASDIPLLAELTLYGSFVEVPKRLFFRRFHPQASSALEGAELQSLFTPGAHRAASGREWRHLWEMTLSMLHAPIAIREKFRVGLFLLRCAKWSKGPLARDLGKAVITVVTFGRRRQA